MVVWGTDSEQFTGSKILESEHYASIGPSNIIDEITSEESASRIMPAPLVLTALVIPHQRHTKYRSLGSGDDLEDQAWLV